MAIFHADFELLDNIPIYLIVLTVFKIIRLAWLIVYSLFTRNTRTTRYRHSTYNNVEILATMQPFWFLQEYQRIDL